MSRLGVAHVQIVRAWSWNQRELHGYGIEPLQGDVGLSHGGPHSVQALHKQPPVDADLGTIANPVRPPEAARLEGDVSELSILSPLEHEAIVEALIHRRVPNVEVQSTHIAVVTQEGESHILLKDGIPEV